MIQELQFTLIACKPTCKIIDVWHNWLAFYRGTINSKLTIWSFVTWADGDMRVWHYNEGFYMERKRDLIISWRYASLAMNRRATRWTYDTPALRQTGSKNPTGQITLPTIWGTYLKLVTKYQIPVINSCLEKCDEKCAYTNVW